MIEIEDVRRLRLGMDDNGCDGNEDGNAERPVLRLVGGVVEEPIAQEVTHGSPAPSSGGAVARSSSGGEAAALGGGGGNRFIAHRLSKVEPRDVYWLWPGRIPLGKVTLMAGDPGLGKSFISLDIAARVSRANPFPDAPFPLKFPGEVLLFSAEDDAADTLRPRLDRMGADVSKVFAITGSKRAIRADGNGGVSDMVRFDKDLDTLDEALSRMNRPRLVVIDPVSAYLGDVDGNSNSQVRAMLSRLADIASRRMVAVLCITHLNKNTTGKAIYRASGSLAFAAAARVVYAVAPHPDKPDERVIVPVKSNLFTHKTSLSYVIDDGRLRWRDTRLMIVPESLDRAETEPADPEALDEAAAWLTDILAPGEQGAAELRSRAEADGIAWRTLQRAKRRLGIRAERRGGADGRWVWMLAEGRRDGVTK